MNRPLKIVITGPECSGKTTLTKHLSAQMKLPYLEELARSYLENKGGNYSEEDLIEIARQHIQLEDLWTHQTDILLLDTDPLTIEIWAEEKFGYVPPFVSEIVAKRHYDLYLLCVPEMPWEFDPLRENPEDRDRLFKIYESRLLKLSKTYAVIRGSKDERLSVSMNLIQKVLSGH